jgi:fumarate reductase flavoprotein subunit
MAGKKMTRRDFIKTTAAGIAGAAAAGGLAACASTGAGAGLPGSWDYEADIVVIGSGGGLAGGIKAAELGLEAIVLEKLDIVGGSTNMHSGVLSCGGGTSLQREAGFEDNPENFAKYLLACAKGQANEALVRALAREIPQTFEWIVSLGARFTTEWMYYTGPENEPFCLAAVPAVMHAAQYPPDAAHPLTGPVIHSYVMNEAEKKGVRLLTGTRAVKLLTGGNGELTGVASVSGGRDINVKARRGVILAGGGMCNNPEMCGQYMRYGEFRVAAGTKGATGDTIKMAMELGADLVNMHESLTSLSSAVPLGTTTRGKTRASFPSIIVNKWGRRYVNEDYHSDTVGKLAQGQEDGLNWQIFDRKSYAAVSDANRARLVEAATIEELAARAGIFRDGLVDTVNRWNAYAARGEDPDYAKTGPTVAPLDTAPYYAFPYSWTIALVVQYGGLKIDENCQVINVRGEKIPRLYAAGIDAGGWLGRNYPGSGTAVGGAYSMARIGAVKLSEYPGWSA